MFGVSQLMKCNQSRWKNIAVLCFVTLVLLYMLFPYLKSSGQKYILLDKNERCLEDKIRGHSLGRDNLDTIVYHNPQTDAVEKYFIPYVGNGHIGISLDDKRGVRIKGRRGLNVPAELNPLVYTSVNGYNAKGATVLDVKAGVLYRYHCYQKSDSFATSMVQISHEIFAHRTRPSILVQDIRIYNPSKEDIIISLSQSSITEWTTALSPVDSKAFKAAQETITWHSAQRRLSWTDEEDGNRGILAAGETISIGVAITPKLTFGDTLIVKAGRSESFHLLSGFKRSGPLQPASADDYDVKELHSSLAQDLRAALHLKPSALKDEHVTSWNKLWSSGFSISVSKAPDALNGDVVNATMYYVLSNVPTLYEISAAPPSGSEQPAASVAMLPESPLWYRPTGAASDQLAVSELLARPDSCFTGYQTLTADKFWKLASTLAELSITVKSWLITLEKQGCSNYLRAGVDGVLQAMILSLGGFRFSKEHNSIAHLEMRMDPSDLHRDILFRRIVYGNTTHVNISVAVGEDNRAMLRVSQDRAERDFYACDADCLDPPQGIGPDGVSLPVKITQPVHPILYVTHNKEHMEELKHALYPKEVKLAPAHDHRVIAMHKHGYSYGGLPITFWIILGTLLITFHLFLFKLIYNECQSAQGNVAVPYRRRSNS